MGKPSALKKTIHVLVTLALLAYLILSPEWILNNLNRSIAEENLSKPAPEWHGRIVIWHVAEFRVYQGSMTDYLQARADAYCRRHAGVHIEVVGLTNKKYNDRMARGAFPDAYSFPSGLVYREQLRQIQPQMPEFAGRLDAVRADGADGADWADETVGADGPEGADRVDGPPGADHVDGAAAP